MNAVLNLGQSWLTTTVTRSTSVVPVYGFVMGDVRPQTHGIFAGMSAKKRHADATTAAVWGPQPWRPPVR